MQDALKSLGTTHLFLFYHTICGQGELVFFVCFELGQHAEKGSDGKDCQIGRYSLLKLDLWKNCFMCIGGAFVAYLLQFYDSFFGC